MEIYTEFEAIIDALEAEGIDYAVCGGIAVLAYGYERFTKDIDLLVQEADLARIKKLAYRLGFTLDSGRIPFGLRTPHRREVHRVAKVVGDQLLMLDLLVVPPFLEDVWDGRKVIKWKNKSLRVVSPEGLIRLKTLAGRSQDIADLEGLGWVENENEEDQRTQD